MNKTLKLSPSCEIVLEVWDTWNDLNLNYIEHSSDHWHSNTETSVGIDTEKAQEIIALLQEFISVKQREEG